MIRSLIMRVLVVGAGVAVLFASGCAPMPLAIGTYEFASEFGAEGTANGRFDRPTGVAKDAAGNTYVADTFNHRIQKFSPAGAHIMSLGSEGSGAGQFRWPRDVDVDADGNVYVLDTNNHRIQKFSSAGAHIMSWGSEGSGAGQFVYPGGLSVMGDSVYVADTDNDRIQKFSLVGVHQATWGTFGSGNGQYNSPGDVAVSPSGGYIFVADTGNSRVQVLDSSGAFYTLWGTPGTGEGQFSRPLGIAVDSENSVYVTEFEGHRVQKFAYFVAWGYVGSFGAEGGSPGEFDSPSGICVDTQGHVYVADRMNHRIQRFRSIPEAVPVEGDNRYETAVETSMKSFPGGSEVVVVATGTNWPDALGGAALAGAAPSGPILLTRTASLPAVVLGEIRRLDPTTAYILGGTAAVSTAVENTLIDELGEGNVIRLGGQNRYETANLVAAEAVQRWGVLFDDHGTAFVATGVNYPDALAGSSISAGRGVPIFLASRSGISEATQQAMLDAGVTEVVILGGEGAVSAAIETELVALLGEGNVDRVGGADRYETSALVAEEGVARASHSWYRVAIATGQSYPDALTGGVMQGRDLSVLVLTRRGSLPAHVEDALVDNKGAIREVRFLGGEGAVGQGVRDQVMDLFR